MDQTISIDYGQGIDSKTDPKLVIQSKFQTIQNGIFTNTKRLTKRNGYDNVTSALVGGGTWSNPTMTATLKNELILAATTSAGQRLLSYSPSLSTWSDKGKYNSVSASKQVINTLQYTFPSENVSPSIAYGTYNSSFASNGNIGLFTYDGMETYGDSNPANDQSFATVVDLQNGNHLADAVAIVPGRAFTKAALIGPSTLAAFYLTNNAAHTIACQIVSVSAGGVSFGAEILVGTSATSAGFSGQFPYCYDVATTATGAVIAICEGAPGIKVYNISPGGTVTLEKTIATTGYNTDISVNVDSSGNIWVYWFRNGSEIDYTVLSSAYATILGQTIVAGGLSNVMQLAGLSTSPTAQTLYYSNYVYSGGSFQVVWTAISSVTVTSGGAVGSPAAFQYGCDIYAKPFTVNSRNYLPVITLSQSQSTIFIVDLADGVAIAKSLQTGAEGVYNGNINETTLLSGRMPGFINTAYVLPGGSIGLCAGYVISLNTLVPTLSSGTAAQATYTYSAQIGTALLSYNFNDIDAYQSQIQQDTLVLNGGIVCAYDGASITELGYNTDPDNVWLSITTSGGTISASVLNYYVTWEWVDETGRIYESAPSLPVVADLNGSTNQVAIQFLILSLTQKKRVLAKIWKSDSTIGGGLAYLVATIPVNSTNTPYIEYSDTTPTNVLNPTLYTKAGAILDNIAPPPAMVLWTNYNRIWCIDSENPETNIEYCKTASAGTGISFSTGFLEVVIDSKFGSMTGASPMDEKTIILKQNGIGYFIGDGANDAGTGSTITNFQFIPSDAGCTNSKSVILYPDGILYRTQKGIYQVSRGVQTVYFGLDVEAYNSQDIRSAFIVPNRNQIRFLTSSGSSLLYDYVMNQWSVFTNHAGLSATAYGGLYVYVRSDGSLYLEDESSYLDNSTAYQMSIQTAWIAFSGVQGFQRAKEVILLGDYQNASGHGISVQPTYDFGLNSQPAVPYYFNASPFQYRTFMKQQKCDAISLLISEITTGASGEYVDITNMSFKALIKGGINRLPQSQSVG